MLHQTPEEAAYEMVDAAQNLVQAHPIISVPTKIQEWGPYVIWAGLGYLALKAFNIIR